MPVVDAAMTAGPVVEEPTAADPRDRAARRARRAARCRLRGEEPRPATAPPDPTPLDAPGGRVRPERRSSGRSCCSRPARSSWARWAPRSWPPPVAPHPSFGLALRVLPDAHWSAAHPDGAAAPVAARAAARPDLAHPQPAGRRRAGAAPPRSGSATSIRRSRRSPGPPNRCASRRRRSCEAAARGGDGVGVRSRRSSCTGRSTRTSLRSPRRRPAPWAAPCWCCPHRTFRGSHGNRERLLRLLEREAVLGGVRVGRR